MFVLTTSYNNFRNHLYDTDTLEDFMLGLTNDEAESKRIATIAGNMKVGDAFSNHDIYLKCMNEEATHAN